MTFQKGNKFGKGGRRQLSDADRILLCQSTPIAIKRQIELMDDPNGKVALLACNAVLDRYYGKPLQMVDIDASITEADPYEDLNDDQIDKINSVYDEAMKAAEEANSDEGDDGESEPS